MTSTRAAGAMLVLLAAVPSAEARRVARAVEVPERERYVIRPDREGTAKQLIADVGFFRPLDGGVIFDAISVERSRVVYLLHRVGQRPADPPLGRIELSPAGLAGFAARTSRSFAIHVEVAGREPAVEAALAAAVRSIGAHDDGDFFTYLGRPVRLRPLEVLGLTPFHPHALFLLVIVAVLVGAWLRATPPRGLVAAEDHAPAAGAPAAAAVRLLGSLLAGCPPAPAAPRAAAGLCLPVRRGLLAGAISPLAGRAGPRSHRAVHQPLHAVSRREPVPLAVRAVGGARLAAPHPVARWRARVQPLGVRHPGGGGAPPGPARARRRRRVDGAGAAAQHDRGDAAAGVDRPAAPANHPHRAVRRPRRCCCSWG